MKKMLCIPVFLVLALTSYAQTTPSQPQGGNSFEPFEPNPSSLEKREFRRAKKSRKSKKSFRWIWARKMDKKRDEFWERMEDNARRDRMIAREMKKPQYSDFSYFGHKRKPKKRPVAKRKFCKECGITH